MAAVTDLPPELLSYMFRFLPAKGLATVAQTCTLFDCATQIDSIWRYRCFQDFNIRTGTIADKNLSWRDLYTKLLYHYGYLIGLWQAAVKHYGGLLLVKFSGSSLEGTEYVAPPSPHVERPLCQQPLFSIDIDAESGQSVTQCCRGNGGEKHLLHIHKCVEEGCVGFKYQCPHPDLHKQHESRRRGHECDIRFSRLPHAPPVPYWVPIEAGLFKGTYGPHGIEILRLHYTPDKQAEIVKITGDPNIPAGQLSVRADLTRSMVLNAEQQDYLVIHPDIDLPDCGPDVRVEELPLQSFRLPLGCNSFVTDIPDTCRFRFHSVGQLAHDNYTKPWYIPTHWIVFDENTFGNLWPDMHALSIYSRVMEDLTDGTE